MAKDIYNCRERGSSLEGARRPLCVLTPPGNWAFFTRESAFRGTPDNFAVPSFCKSAGQKDRRAEDRGQKGRRTEGRRTEGQKDRRAEGQGQGAEGQGQGAEGQKAEGQKDKRAEGRRTEGRRAEDRGQKDESRGNERGRIPCKEYGLDIRMPECSKGSEVPECSAESGNGDYSALPSDPRTLTILCM